MIIDKEVKVKLNGSNIKHYKSLGYDIVYEKDKKGRSKKASLQQSIALLRPSDSFSTTTQPFLEIRGEE